MQKKIIAACCLTVAVTLIFTACGNKYQMIETNGVLHPVVTDAEGNTEVNEDGQIAVYVTDSSGDVVTNSDGSVQKNYVDFPDVIVDGNSVETLDYKFTMPSDFEPNDMGVFYKKGTDSNCSAKVVFVQTADADSGETAETVFNENAALNEEYIEQVKATYPDAVMNVEQGALADGTQYYAAEYIIKDETGAVIHYAYSAYFGVGDSVYLANYVCINGIGYDESFDFRTVVENDIVIK